MNRLTRTMAALTAVALCSTAAFAQDNAELSVLHAVPNVTVDVYVNGNRELDDFTPATLAGPLSLPAGTYEVRIVAGTDPDGSNPIIGPLNLPLAAGTSYTAVAHLDAAAAPTATLFTNDTTAAGPGQGKVTVRHTAANAEGVEIVVDGSVSLGTFNNGGELGPVGLPAGTYSAAIVAGGNPVPPTPADVPVTERQNIIVYAWGDAAGGSVNIATQAVPLDGGVPMRAADVTPVPTLGPLGLVAMIGALLLFARRFLAA